MQTGDEVAIKLVSFNFFFGGLSIDSLNCSEMVVNYYDWKAYD